MKYNKNRKASKQHLEVLEDRRLMSAVLMNGTAMELHGDANQDNTFVVRAASANRVFGYANNFGEASNGVNQVVVYLGTQTDTVKVSQGVTTPVEVVDSSGQITWLQAGESRVFNGGSHTITTGGGDGVNAGHGSSNSTSGSSTPNSGFSHSHS